MKKLIIILFVITGFNLNAQYITNYAKNVKQTEVDGFYYYLPRNVIRIDFDIEKKQEIKGKYSSYAKELLYTDDYIKENKLTYQIKDVSINVLTEADPEMVFFVSGDDKLKDTPKFELSLNENGIISSVGMCDDYTDSHKNNMFDVKISEDNIVADYTFIPNIDEDIEGEESDNKLTDKDIAKSIVEEILKLRTAYFDLISGFQEVNYGTTLNYMVCEIKTLENQYLSLFLGKTLRNNIRKTVYVIPEPNKNTVMIGKFSDVEGFDSKGGEIVKINFTDQSEISAINRLTKDEIENTTYNNKIFYRNPADVNVQLIIGDKILFENRLKISQLGFVNLIPINKMKLRFDVNTGQILSVGNDE